MIDFAGQPLDLFRTIHLSVNKASSAYIRFKTPPSTYYNTGGYFTLVDGIKATRPRINSQWLGWSGEDLELEMDLGTIKSISKVEIGFLKEESAWIYLPKDISIWFSENGMDYKPVLKNQNVTQEAFKFTCAEYTTRFIKIIARHADRIASGKSGSGSKAWLFCDDIQVQ
jgi:hexosaminidase